MFKPLYTVLASTLSAYQNCCETGNTLWRDKRLSRLQALVLEHMPSGSGIDTGTKLRINADKPKRNALGKQTKKGRVGSTPEKLVFDVAFHHMNDVGMYDGWTEHTVTVRGSLQFGIRLTIGGSNRNEIKDYLHEVFDLALREEVEW